MATETASPILQAEMADWIALGGTNLGIVGDPAHTYGYHRGAYWVPSTDYSRRRDPQGSDGPYTDWDWACAGDFGHNGVPRLREMHRQLLARLMGGQHPSVCEFIGQPVAGEPVLYWSRWGGLEQYTGPGHDRWSHVSTWRSMAGTRPYLWRATPVPPKPKEDDTMIFLVQVGTGTASVWWKSVDAERRYPMTRWNPIQALRDQAKVPVHQVPATWTSAELDDFAGPVVTHAPGEDIDIVTVSDAQVQDIADRVAEGMPGYTIKIEPDSEGV